MGTKSRKPNTELTPELKTQVLDYFFTAKDNRITVVAKKFGISLSSAGKIVDDEFKRRMRNKKI